MKKVILSLCIVLISFITKAQDVKEVSRHWSVFTQSIEVKTDTVKKFKVTASAKVETYDNKAWAGIIVRVVNKPNEGKGFYDNMWDRSIWSDTWESFTVEGTIDPKSEKINFGATINYNGKFYFDKFELYIEDDNGEYELIKTTNSSFETQVIDNKSPGWKQGSSNGNEFVTKEFTYTTSDDSVDGNYSILVEGKGISTAVFNGNEKIPYIGVWITLIYLLILVFSFMTYTSQIHENSWSKLGLIGFRFSFVYFLLFILFQNNGAYPYWDEYVMKIPSELLHDFIPWVGKNILNLPYDITTFTNGSGDTTYDYVMVFVIFIIAVLSTIVWSILDRKRTNYTKLYYWLTTALRYYVGLMLISYGLSKVIQLQFPSNSYYRLLQTYGESSPMGLAWTFLGFSKGYNMFMGIAEILAGLLLFRRTMTLGAIITLMTAMNVMAVNYFYDVPVKIISTHLVIITLFLLSRNLVQLISFLVTNREVEKLALIKRPQLKKGFNVSLGVLKGLIIVYALGYGFYSTKQIHEEYYGTKASKSELHGAYDVTNYVINGNTMTNYKNPRLWSEIIFDRPDNVMIRYINKQVSDYKTNEDSLSQKIKFIKYNTNDSDYFNFNYIKTDRELDFNYVYKNDTISGKAIRRDKKKRLK